MSEIRNLDVLIVGAGFAGMYLLHRLRTLEFSVVAVEAAPEVGGTWYHNRYPGLRCDVESLQYQYSWSDDLRNSWNWSERYPPQSEILSYAKWVADTCDLRRDIQFNTKIVGAEWDENNLRWTAHTESGELFHSRFLILATGALSVPRLPNIPNLEAYRCKLVHTADWPRDGIEFSGQTVGLIGTGSSGVQVATAIADQVANLSIFQRTPAYTIPARNRALKDEDRQDFRDNFAKYNAKMNATSGGILNDPPQHAARDVPAETRETMLQAAWERGGSFTFTATFNDVRINEASNRIVADFVKERIREIVMDPKTAHALCPDDFIATRRVCIDTGYYEIFNRTNVDLVDVSQDAIESFTEKGLRLASGAEHAFDTLVLATGYDAMTGAVLALDLRGADGQTIQDVWKEGPKTYLGLAVSGFPNLFTITGPGSPSVLANVLRSIEHHIDWITDCLASMRREGTNRIEATSEAQNDWVAHVNDVADKTLFTKGPSWYMGADIPGKPRVFMPYAGGLPRYRDICKKVVEQGYNGFSIV